MQKENSNRLVSSSRRNGRKLALDEQSATIGFVVFLFAGHILAGADNNFLSLVASIFYCGLLIALISRPWFQRALVHSSRFKWPGIFFGVTLIVSFLSLFGIGSGSVNQIWTLVRRPPVSTIDISSTLLGDIKLAALACPFLVGVGVGRSRSRMILARRALLIAFALFGGWAFIGFALAPQKMMGLFPQAEVYPPRLNATLVSANTAATLFGTGTVLGLEELFCILASSGKSVAARSVGQVIKVIMRPLPLVCLLICSTCLVLTGSRSGLAATGLALAVLIVWEGLAAHWTLAATTTAAGTFATAAIALFILSGSSVLQRLGSLKEAGFDRWTVYSTHQSLVLKAPWRGFGLGTFGEVNRMLISERNFASIGNLGAMHNVLLQWLEQGGILGAAPIFLSIGLLMVAVARRSFDPDIGRTARLIIGSTIVFLIHGLSDFALEIPSMTIFFAALLGLGYGAGAKSRTPATLLSASRAGPLPQADANECDRQFGCEQTI